ncbi:helix-turn-helix domain-containing protein [Carboxylicivirga marina]|uniref:Helix-turn-helix transcriptional regulator n=1 Tax=Carboxylicivirga marina TaxID=2800988 RepID=A0ABS1HJA3_9BACT|nr:helix-turn-helix transcriptional regulator [Carboxylicivirga marina]MBK3517706.1 helix-turn-helix transcriptional regulator [Carboxylicivirga marina]
MKERIEAIIQHERLTPSQFADAIGVQRSGVSHILSGRNKPSLDFLNKLLNKYPHYSGDWLITGLGNMLSGVTSTAKPAEQLSIPDSVDKPKSSFKMPKKVLKDEEPAAYKANQSKPQERPHLDTIQAPQKAVERIVVFYSDKTFSEYRPE